jgi:saccharopepsin
LNPAEPNFIALALERDSDQASTVQGSLGVGELATEYASVSDTTKIPLFPPEGSTRWTILLDSFAVNGVQQNVSSVVQDVPAGRVAVLLDSGTTYSYAPPAVASAIYSSFPGATLSADGTQWSMPCSAGIRLTLWIGYVVLFSRYAIS